MLISFIRTVSFQFIESMAFLFVSGRKLLKEKSMDVFDHALAQVGLKDLWLLPSRDRVYSELIDFCITISVVWKLFCIVFLLLIC